MIQKMKKLTFLVTNKEYEQFLTDIRQLGVIHIEELQAGATSEELQAGLALAERYKNVFKVLDYATDAYAAPEVPSSVDIDDATAMNLLDRVEALNADELSLKHQLDAVEKNIAALEPWGDFRWDNFRALEREGYAPTFYVCSSKLFKQEWADKYFATPISEQGGKTYFVTFSAERPDITAEALVLPDRTLSDYLAEESRLEAEIERVHNQMLAVNEQYRGVLTAGRIDNENAISLSKVHLSHESIAGDAVRLLVGWTLAEKVDPVVNYLEDNHIYYELADPSFDDNVPIQIQNNKFASLFEPILRMYSLPNYHDIDPLPLFAPFFMLFFGLCMGDAGYGTLILAASIAICLLKPNIRKYGLLGACLGGMTIVCGLITGTFFGIDLSTVDWDWIKPLQPYFLNDSKKDSFFGYSPMMVISVIIGLIQVLIGMTMAGCKAVKNYGWVFGIGKFSWVTALVSATILFGLPLFGVELSQAVQYVLYGLIGLSVLGIFFLNSPAAYRKPVVGAAMNIGSGLWATYGMATGLLGDLLSYIRLFALGLTGGVLGSVFNSLAIDMTSSLGWGIRWLPLILILLFGHGINFALCMISSFVHPMRLTFVEYFKNAEFEGGGNEYDPFRIKTN
jgi:V/A-type H+-transporting ATPase subunit I